MFIILLAFIFGVFAAETKYDIVVVAGQSNGVGRGLGSSHEEEKYLQYADRLFQLGRFGADNLKVIPASEPLQHWGQAPGSNVGRKGFAIPFALRYAGSIDPDRKVLFIPAARGSTSILQWDAEIMPFNHASMDDSTLLYDDMVIRIKHALSLNPENRVIAVFWQQGEADITAIANPHSKLRPYMNQPSLYQEKLEDLRARLRKDIGQFPFFVGGVTPAWQPVNGSDAGMKAKIDVTEAMKKAVAADPGPGVSVFVDSKTLTEPTDTNENNDDIHYSAEGCRRLGILYYEAFQTVQSKNK